MQKLTLFLLIAIIGTNINLSAKYINIDTTVNIQNQQRFIGLYVPETVPLIDSFDVVIVLHHNDETAIECRERVINELKWDTLFKKALFAFPDAGDSKEFYNPTDNEHIIDSTLIILNTRFPVKKHRKIMISSGLNCRSAMKYSYNLYSYFTWLILIDPMMKGLNDVQNIKPTSIGYYFDGSKYVNTAILKNDVRNIYLDSLERRLMIPGSRVLSLVSSNLSSKYPEDTLMLEAISYLTDPEAGDNDSELKEIRMPIRICNLNIRPYVFAKHLRGNGFIGVDFTIMDLSTKYKFNTSASTGSPFSLVTPAINSFGNILFGGPLKSGKSTFRFSISDRYNKHNYLDTIDKSIYYQPDVFDYPISMGFEESDTTFDKYWFIEPSGDITTWAIDSLNSSAGENSLSKHNSKYQYDNPSQSENFFTPFVDLTKLLYKSITFDYAFNYQIYEDNIKTDTLRVYITTDCDNSYELLYEASGTELATSPSPIFNPKNNEDSKYIPQLNNWKHKIIDLTKYKLEEKISIKFSIVSGMGGSTYLDNIRIGDAVSSVSDNHLSKFDVYPNPIKDIFHINKLNPKTSFVVRDILGKEVLKVGKNESYFNIDFLQSGIYFITDELGNTNKFIKD